VANYKNYSWKQKKYIPVSFEEQIIPGTFGHALDHLNDHCADTSVFDRGFQNDDTGAPVYNIKMLLKNRIICLLARWDQQPQDRSAM
jgi:hypothetical protein